MVNNCYLRFKINRAMKSLLLILLTVITGIYGVRAQNIALGERVPELKIASWLDGRQPAPAPLTYIEFYHSSNKEGIRSLDRLKTTAGELGGRLRVVVVVQEKEDKVADVLLPYVSGQVGVGFDPSGRSFSNFGVTYLPFGVLTDAKNRALWMGNTLQLTPAFIEKIAK